jgi:SAM-dependent methyltransferase
MTTITEQFGNVSNDEWLVLLQRSVREPYIDGVAFPRFPHAATQIGFNGAADEEAMVRAHAFWLYAEGYSKALGRPLSASTPVLDIGCGWGRITRVFTRDVPANALFGIDIDPDAIALSRALGIPANFTINTPGSKLPFPDASFAVVVASSVFTHLSEGIAMSLLREVLRVMHPSGLFVFTVEDESLLETLAQPGSEGFGKRWQLMSCYKPEIEVLKKRYREGKYVYLVTNKEKVRGEHVYGDALIPKSWIESNCCNQMSIIRFEPSAAPVYQAVVVGQKTAL